ncbi:hypothetical protein NT01EI_2013 [Edwardsiella ictaluri 93-146]|uniref:Lipoprotein n=1 Tax=Edwardsiella ictaluri (strain 93-146) TaxID=634503 RepID=C5BBL8_EDWI9|nr:hypothetical protein NT01EI_2013 [Edwardsiella ictaluri 93-146]STP80916.1 Uncharacterised protein [Edwardsiella ictaluri]
MRINNWTKLKPMLLVLPLMLSACGVRFLNCGSSWQTVPPAESPPLVDPARQAPLPDFCLPTCSANLSNAMQRWQPMLTGPELPTWPVSGSTMP